MPDFLLLFGSILTDRNILLLNFIGLRERDPPSLPHHFFHIRLSEFRFMMTHRFKCNWWIHARTKRGHDWRWKAFFAIARLPRIYPIAIVYKTKVNQKVLRREDIISSKAIALVVRRAQPVVKCYMHWDIEQRRHVIVTIVCSISYILPHTYHLFFDAHAAHCNSYAAYTIFSLIAASYVTPLTYSHT